MSGAVVDTQRWTRLGRVADIPRSGAVRVDLGDGEMAVFRVDDAVHAVDGACPHAAAPLAEGTRRGTVVECPWHGWRFDLLTGRRLDQVGTGVRVYPVQVRDGWVEVCLEEVAS